MFAIQYYLENGILLGSGRDGGGSRYQHLSGDSGTQLCADRGCHSEEDRLLALGANWISNLDLTFSSFLTLRLTLLSFSFLIPKMQR